MGRSAVKILLDEFKQKVIDYVNKNYDSHYDDKINLTIKDLDIKEYEDYKYSGEIMSALLNNTTIDKDIQKISFNYENSEYDSIEVLNNGLPVMKCVAGGDWEYPVYFIIYWDGKQFRGYTPENGNTFNRITRTASGSEGDYGIEIAHNSGYYNREILKKLIPEIRDIIDLLNKEEFQEKIDEIFERYQDLIPDWDLMEKDIINRIEVK